MPIHFLSNKATYIPVEQSHWRPVLQSYNSTAVWTRHHRSFAFWNNRVYNTYHNTFRFFDHFRPSPVDQLASHFGPGEDWSATHLPFFVPVDNSTDLTPGADIGSIVLIPLDSIEFFRYPGTIIAEVA